MSADRSETGAGPPDPPDPPSGWNLERVKRAWVPDWLWRLFCFGNLATFTPWKEILTEAMAPCDLGGSETRILTDEEMAAIMDQAKRERELGLDRCPSCQGRNLYPKPMYGPNVLGCMACGCRWDAKARCPDCDEYDCPGEAMPDD